MVRGVRPEGTPYTAFAGARAAFPTAVDTPAYLAVIDANDAAEERHDDEASEVCALIDGLGRRPGLRVRRLPLWAVLARTAA